MKKVKLVFTEEVLGTIPGDKDIYREFIASKAPDAATLEEEVEAFGVDETAAKGKTYFRRDSEGNPVIWDYAIKGFFKDAAGMLSRAAGMKSGKLKAYKKIIDGLVFVYAREIPLLLPAGGMVGDCSRPLRAQTAQGERVSLASSESAPKGSALEFEVEVMPLAKEPKLLDECLIEWLDYGAKRGIGQWRNSGKGRFTYELIGK
jgi:hypothetical protein